MTGRYSALSQFVEKGNLRLWVLGRDIGPSFKFVFGDSCSQRAWSTCEGRLRRKGIRSNQLK